MESGLSVKDFIAPTAFAFKTNRCLLYTSGKETMPAIVRDLDDDAAIILMVDANLQRESILPSARAFAYKMKLDAIKHLSLIHI